MAFVRWSLFGAVRLQAESCEALRNIAASMNGYSHAAVPPDSLAILITDFLSCSQAFSNLYGIDWPHFLHADQNDNVIVLLVSLA